jgi:sugar lactone lactonase YvrE
MRVRKVLAGVVTLVVLAFLGGAIVVGRGHPSGAIDLGSGNAWFPTIRTGSVSLIDGSTGRRVTRVDGVAAANGHFDVAQSGSSALVVDQDAGTVTRVDAATWKSGAPLPIGSHGDSQLAVHTAGDTAWVVTQAGTIVQQLDPDSMTTIGAPQNLPNEVSGIAVAADGRLWVTSRTGELRSYRNGEQITSAALTGMAQTKLVLVNKQPVVVDTTNGHALLIDEERGTVDHPVCLDVPTSPAPAIAGSTSDEPWLLAVAPNAGTLLVSDVDTGKCQAIPLGDTATSPRYGEPVEKDRFVYVPDFVDGKVIVIDPARSTGRQIVTKIDLSLPKSEVALLVHHQHVWFNEVKGDEAGVITDDLRALHTSKVGGQQDGPPEAPGGDPESTKPSSESDPESGGLEPGADPTGPTSPTGPTGPTRPGGPTTSTTSTTAVTTPGPKGSLPLTTPTTPPVVVTPTFTISPTPAVIGKPVIFRDTTVPKHTIARWDIPGAAPAPTAVSPVIVTFAGAGTIEITLTIDTDGGAQIAKASLRIDTLTMVPNLARKTRAEAQAELAKNNLAIGNSTAKVNSIFPAGQIIDSNPAAGMSVATGTPVDYRESAGSAGIITTYASAASAGLSGPRGLAADGAGNVYVAEPNTHRVKRINPNGTVTIVAGNGVQDFSGDGGRATSASLDVPTSVAVNGNGNLFIIDGGNNNSRIRMVTPGGIISTFAGNGATGGGTTVPGKATDVSIGEADGIAFDGQGNLFITDATNRAERIYRVTPQGQLTVVATGGIPLNSPNSIAFGPGGQMYVGSAFGDQILRLDNGNFTRVVGLGPNGPSDYNGEGTAGTATAVGLVAGLRFDASGNLYFSDFTNNRIRVLRTDGKVYTVAGNGARGAGGDNRAADQAQLNLDLCCASNLAFDLQGNLYFSDADNDRIRKVGVAPPS